MSIFCMTKRNNTSSVPFHNTQFQERPQSGVISKPAALNKSNFPQTNYIAWRFTMHHAVQIGGETLSAPQMTPSDLSPPKRMVRHLDLQSTAVAQVSLCWLVVKAVSRRLFPRQTPSTMPMLIEMLRSCEGSKLTRTVLFRYYEL
jgi:hypothetical protein